VCEGAKILPGPGRPRTDLDLIRQHAGAGLVAAGIFIAGIAEGFFQPTAYAAASIVIWAALIAGLVGRALPTAAIGRGAAAAGICLALTAVLATASVAWASDQGRAFEEAVRVSFYLALFSLAVCTAAPGARREWLGGMAAGVGALSVVALFAYLQPGILDSGHSDIPNAAGRLSYPTGYWNATAALLAAAAVLLAYEGAQAPSQVFRAAATAAIPLAALGIWLASSRGGAASLIIGWAILIVASGDRVRQLLTVAIAGVATAVLILAAEQMDALTSGLLDSARRTDGDRMSAIAIAIVALTAFAAWRLDEWRPRLRIPRRALVAAGAVAAAGLIAAVIAVNPGERFREFKAAPSASRGVPVGAAGLSSNGRWQFWTEAVDAFESAPVGGVGAGGYEDYWARHADVPLFVRNPHSLALQQGAELGIVGIALFLGFLAAVAVSAHRRLTAGRAGDAGVLVAVLVAGAAGAAVDWTWEVPAAFGSAVVCAGLLASSAPSRRLLRDGYWLGIAFVALAWAGIIAGGLVVLSDLQLDQSREAATANRVGDGIHRAEEAHIVQPWSAEPFTQLALLEEQRGDVDQALADLREAEERDSEDWRLPLIEARLQMTRGDQSAARMALERARQLSPMFGGAVLNQG
jgi:O-Antigen ligase